jgi:hypothetical protein
MRKNEQFNDILNECLDRILKGQTVEECLQKHPAEAQELEPLLRTALAARVASTIKPRPEFKSRARYEFQAAVRNLETGKTRRPFFSGWQWRWPFWLLLSPGEALWQPLPEVCRTMFFTR